ncbi:MAG: 2-hydroxyacid dehydrogenase [Anderseniella sp.]|nr:2-hydroxyacid dehydrogenase [Anderseniella sp.]
MTDILLVSNMMPHIQEALEARHTLHRLYEADDKDAFLASVADKIEGVATMGKADADLIDALPSLKIIASFGVGYDGVNAAHAASRNVIATNTPDVLNDDVANMAVTLVLTCSRRFSEWERFARAGRWEKEGDPPLARAINGRKVGILGLGRIGKDIARKLDVFGCVIGYHGRSKQADQAYAFYDDLTDMARDCDFVIAICPGGDATKGIVNAQVLEALGPDGTFINVARGSVHDEDALIEALASGKLGYAGLDVFAAEPKIPEKLRALDNVTLQPHQGSATVETRRAMGDLVANNLLSFFDGKGAITPVAECADIS